MNNILINEVVKRYTQEYSRYCKLSDLVLKICEVIVFKNLAIRATIQHRVKAPESLVEKLRKNIKCETVDSVFESITDLSGVRIITYQETDRPKVVAEIIRIFSGIDNEEIKVEIKDKNGDNGLYYKGTHCLVTLPKKYVCEDVSSLTNIVCEIQVCSLLSHVYNEIEHDLQYKTKTGLLSDDEKALIDELGLITQAGDTIIHKLLQATDKRINHYKSRLHI